MRLLDQDSRSGLIRLLNAPVLTRRSLGQQLLRSWAAQPLIDALGDLIQVDSAKGTERISSERILSTMEKLLTEAPQVSTLDLLEALPAERLRVNLDEVERALSGFGEEFAVVGKGEVLLLYHLPNADLETLKERALKQLSDRFTLPKTAYRFQEIAEFSRTSRDKIDYQALS